MASSKTIELKFRRAEKESKGSRPDVALNTKFTEKLQRVFQDYALKEQTDNEERGQSGESSSSDAWKKLKFRALDQVAYLSADQTPKSARLRNGHVIRVTASNSSASSSNSSSSSSSGVAVESKVTGSVAATNQQSSAADDATAKPSKEVSLECIKGTTKAAASDPLKPLAPERQLLTPETAESCKKHGNRLFESRQFIEAAIWYTKGLVLDPKDAVLYSNRAVVYLEMAKGSRAHDEKGFMLLSALRSAEFCTRLKDDWYRGHERMACVMAALGCTAKAMLSMSKAMSRAPPGVDPSERAKTLNAPGQIVRKFKYNDEHLQRAIAQGSEAPTKARAQEELKLLLELLPVCMKSQWAKLAAEREDKESEEPEGDEVEYDFAVPPEQGPSADELRSLGNDSFRAKKYLEAARFYTKALKCDLSNSVVYCNRAAAFLEVAKEAPPADALKLGLSLTQYQEFILGVAYCDAELCVMLNPDWIKGHYRLTLVLEAMGCKKAAQSSAAVVKKLAGASDNPKDKDFPAKLETLNRPGSTVCPMEEDRKEKALEMFAVLKTAIASGKKDSLSVYGSSFPGFGPGLADLQHHVEVIWLEFILRGSGCVEDAIKARVDAIKASCADNLKSEPGHTVVEVHEKEKSDVGAKGVNSRPEGEHGSKEEVEAKPRAQEGKGVQRGEGAEEGEEKGRVNGKEKDMELKEEEKATAQLKTEPLEGRSLTGEESEVSSSNAEAPSGDAVPVVPLENKNENDSEKSWQMKACQANEGMSSASTNSKASASTAEAPKAEGSSIVAPSALASSVPVVPWFQPLTLAQSWAAGKTEQQQYDWLIQSYRVRESGDQVGPNAHFHREDCCRLALMPFLIFCKMLLNRQLLPPNWNWQNFLARASLGEKPLVLFKYNATGPEAFLNGNLMRQVAFPVDPGMVKVSDTVYGCKCGEHWPIVPLCVRNTVEIQLYRWVRGRSTLIFKNVGGMEVWKRLELKQKREWCVCENYWLVDSRIRFGF